MQKKSEILVIGGGVVGMAAAYELSKRGAQVTVIDRGEPGMGCSYGNAGWITPCFAMPLPMPGKLLESIGWLFDPESPLYIKPSADPLLFRWLFRFLKAMNTPQMLRSVAALTEVSRYSIDAYAKLAQEHAFGFERRGLLMISQTPKGVAAAVEEMELVAKHGIPGKFLDETAIKTLEPAVVGKVEGGVYFPTEAHAEPLDVVRALTDGAKKNGARILSGTEVYDFNVQNGKIESVKTTHGEMRADEYVLATGSFSYRIGKQLGLNIPVMAGKGYAIIVPSFEPAPKLPIMFIERKIAITPRKDTIRLAGTLELVNGDESITPRRVEAILRGSRRILNVPEKPEIREVWRGLRPCTPDGVPVIGRSSKILNLVLSTGHQMLGLQSAPGSGLLTAELTLRQNTTFDPKPFDPDRF